MDQKLVDIILHLDETIDHHNREQLQDSLRALDGVMTADSHDEKPHLIVIGYDPDVVASSQILSHVQHSGIHAEMIGL